MSDRITDLPVANSIDGNLDTFPIVTNSLNTTQQINRNTFLNILSQPTGNTDTQTLTNKTLTSPTISSPTLSGTIAGTYTLGGTPTFPSSVTQNTATQTLTNKTLTSPTINSPTITNATITADTITGYTTSNSGTFYGIPVTTGAISNSSAFGTSVILPSALLSGTGSSWVWQTWTPTLTNLTGGTLNYSKYIQMGKTVFFRLKYTLAGAGISGGVSISLPVTANSGYTDATDTWANVQFNDTDSLRWLGYGVWASSTTIQLLALTSGTFVSLSSSVPFTWGSGDEIMLQGFYEAA